MRIVAALGGNALLRRGEPMTAEAQERNVAAAVASLAPLAAKQDLVVTHGNGPQVGLLAQQSEDVPLDVLDAETEGMIGYLIARAFAGTLPLGKRCVTLLTQIEIDPDDPAFGHPTKPIGPVYTADVAERLGSARGWRMARDGDGWRRVVACPKPQRILEGETIRLLVDEGVLVICAGGGGIPVRRQPDGRYAGVEAVIDKDLASALLAREIGADALLLLTDVDAVYDGWEGPAPRAIRRAAPAALRAMRFPEGSMGPKVTAGCDFADATGGRAYIGALTAAADMLSDAAGTLIDPHADGIAFETKAPSR